MRHVSDIVVDDERGVWQIALKFLSVADRDEFIFSAPEDKRGDIERPARRRRKCMSDIFGEAQSGCAALSLTQIEFFVAQDEFGCDDGSVVVCVAQALFNEASGVDFLKQRAEGSVLEEGKDDGAVAIFHGVSAAINEDEAAHFFGMLERISPSDVAAHRGSTEDEFFHAELSCDLIDEVDVGVDGVVVIDGGSGEAVAGDIQSDDAVYFAELLDPWLPAMERCVGSMDEDDGRAVGAALIADVGSLSAGEGDELRSGAGIFVVYLFGGDVVAQQRCEGENEDEDNSACYGEDGFCGGGHADHFKFLFVWEFINSEEKAQQMARSARAASAIQRGGGATREVCSAASRRHPLIR